MPRNLRDRGYSSSMDGYKPAPYHSRRKKTEAGTAQVRKGEEVTRQSVRDSGALRLPSPEEIRASYGKAPVNAGPPQRSEPLNLQFSDVHDEGSHESNVEIPFQMFNIERNIGKSEMSLDEIRRRMQELERALNSAYDSQRARVKVRPYTDYNWDVAEAIDDNLLGLNANEPTQQLAFMDYQKAARAGETATNTPEVDELFHEYNNLKNEYNARLAQYLQGLR